MSTDRLPEARITKAAVFLVTVLIVVSAGTLGAIVEQADRSPKAYPEYDPETLDTDQLPAAGSVPTVEAEGEGVVLIDTAHSNRVNRQTVEPLISGVAAAGYDVGFTGPSSGFDDALARADALVVIDPGRPYDAEDVDRVETFVDQGGRLVLIGEPSQMALSQGLFGATVSQRDPEITSLSTRFGFQFGEAALYNMGLNDGNYENIFTEPTGDDRLVDGVDRTTMYIAASVESPTATPLLVAADGTRSIRADTTGDYAVAMREGDVLAIGDKSFLGRGTYNVADNEEFIGNVVEFLVGAQRSKSVLDYPAIVDRDPTIRYTSAGLLNAAQVIGRDVRETRGSPTLTLSRGGFPADRTDVLVTTFDHLGENPNIRVGIRVTGDRVRVAGFESSYDSVYVIRDPEGPIDLVIAADTPSRARLAAQELVAGTAGQDQVSASTIVERTSSEPPEPPDTDDEPPDNSTSIGS